MAFGVLYIANPDLDVRIRKDADLAQPDASTFYGGTEKGYTDYPTLVGAKALHDSNPAITGAGVTIAFIDTGHDWITSKATSHGCGRGWQNGWHGWWNDGCDSNRAAAGWQMHVLRAGTYADCF